MYINDSGNVRNHIRLRSIVTAALVHLILIILTVGIWLIAIVVICLATHLIVNGEIESINRDGTRFRKTYPLRYYGVSYGDFLHVFTLGKNIDKDIASAIEHQLVANTPIAALSEATITDVDGDINAPERRNFILADAGRTSRGTSVTLLFRMTSFGNMHTVRWWVMAGGYLDYDKRFNFIAYAPIFFWFWIIPYMRGDYDILSPIRTIYSSTYNSFDVTSKVRCLHEAVFSALVGELEKHGVDTSDLKAQRMQVLNVNVSGGQLNLGAVVQGAMNKVIGQGVMSAA